MLWYTETKQKLYEIFQTSDDGLSPAAVDQRQKEYGLNQLGIRGESIWKVIFEPFRNVFVAVLLAAAAISLWNDEPIDMIIIGSIIVINAVVFYTQHYATQRVLRTLKKHSESTVLVTRGGKDVELSSVQLVPGDIITVQEGDRVPADARVVHTDSLQVDEAALTGESTSVQKHASTLTGEKQVYEQTNMLFQGTYVVAGSANAIVVATGSRTEFGRIADLASGEPEHSPVQKKIDHLVSLLIKVIAVVVVFVLVLQLWRGIPADEAIRFALSLSVSAVPEGLPVALTVIIVLGMRRMAKQKALVRSFKAIEDVGLITTIATDKTGTLTKNKLSVIDSWSVDESNDAIAAILRTVDGDEPKADPLDIAIYESGVSSAKADKFYPFDASLRISGAFYANDKKLYIKGSPEHILAGTQVSETDRHTAESQMHRMASNGYRVIAVAYYDTVETAPASLSDVDKPLQFIGFVAFADELRPDSARAIRLAHKAGIDVKLITGDHYETAYNIAKTVNLAEHPSQVFSGDQLPSESAALSSAVRSHSVFARILPEDKYRILQSLKETEITAMTGDGVNDVPALANAHVGFAMGSGNDIARDSGDIVLLKDSFSTIIKAISEGRKIYDNIRRMLFYLLATTLGEVITMIGALLLGLPLPVTAIQILWINIVTDTAMVLPLGLEPAEKGHMNRPPRRPNEPILSKILVTRMILVALTIAIVAIFAVIMLYSQGYEDGYIQTVVFMALIAAQWMNVLNARSEYDSAFRRLSTLNAGLGIGFAVAFILQMVVMFGPLAGPFHIQEVPIMTLVIWSVISMTAVLIVGEVHKWIVRLQSSRKTS